MDAHKEKHTLNQTTPRFTTTHSTTTTTITTNHHHHHRQPLNRATPSP